MRELSDRPFVVDHVVPSLDAEAFEATLTAGPAAVSFALGEPGEPVARAHERAIEVIHQVDASIRHSRRSSSASTFHRAGQRCRRAGHGVVPRVIPTAFVEEWHGRFDEAAAQATRLRAEIMGFVRAGRPEALAPFTGQTAGLVTEVLPTAEIVRRMADDACEALRRGGRAA